MRKRVIVCTESTFLCYKRSGFYYVVSSCPLELGGDYSGRIRGAAYAYIGGKIILHLVLLIDHVPRIFTEQKYRVKGGAARSQLQFSKEHGQNGTKPHSSTLVASESKYFRAASFRI